MDTDGTDFVLGGQTSSTDLVSSTATPNPYLVYLLADGTISWARQFSTAYNSVAAVKFDSATSPASLFAALNYISGQASTIIFFSKTGTLLNSYKMWFTYKVSTDNFD
jgi:hypothetical protein